MGTAMSLHPGDQDLMAWLESRHDGSDHIARCERCARRLEEITSLESRLVAAAHAVTNPPDGLVTRIDTRIQERMRSMDALATAGGLFSLSWRTIDTLWNDND